MGGAGYGGTVDTDFYELNQEHKRDFEEIFEYCKNNGDELIWFCHDVEEVFIGKKVSDTDKVKTAREFNKNNKISMINVNKLQQSERKAYTSNMIVVLDKYLMRKSRENV